MRTLLLLLLTTVWGLASQPNPPAVAVGNLTGTATGTICTVNNPYATFYTVIIDGVTGGGSVATAAVETPSTSGGTFQPITAPAYNAISTASLFQVITIQGPLPFGVSVVLTAHTSGQVSAAIFAN